MSYQKKDRICILCTQVVSDAIDLYSEESVERGLADRMAGILEVPLKQDDGISSHVCQLCNAKFGHLVHSLDVHRLKARKNYEKLAKKAGKPCECMYNVDG